MGIWLMAVALCYCESVAMKRLIFLNVAFVTLSCSNSRYHELLTTDCSEQALEQVIKDGELEFSITLPSDYVVERNFDVLDISSVKRTEKENYIESCGLTVEPNSMNYKLGEFYQNAVAWDKQEYSKDYSNFSIIDQGNVIINDVDFIWNSYRYGDQQTLNFFATSNQNTYRLMFLSYEQHFDSVFCNYANIAKSLVLGEL